MRAKTKARTKAQNVNAQKMHKNADKAGNKSGLYYESYEQMTG